MELTDRCEQNDGVNESIQGVQEYLVASRVDGDRQGLTERELQKMSVDLQAGSQPSGTAHRRLSTPNGTLFEILASPEEVGDEICFIRGTMPPGNAVPLHSHSDWELLYVLAGEHVRNPRIPMKTHE